LLAQGEVIGLAAGRWQVYTSSSSEWRYQDCLTRCEESGQDFGEDWLDCLSRLIEPELTVRASSM
jgi:hypothetical protein